MTRTKGRLHAVILAGGAGERFWPASRQRLPKPFLRVVGGRSLLQATLARARRIAGSDRIWLVCGRQHAKRIRSETGIAAGRVLVEPMRRDTAMAVGYAAARISAVDPEAVLAVLPADHVIPDERAFGSAMKKAARGADAGALVTFGVQPKRPDTTLGYIQRGPAVGPKLPGLHRVRRFVEKPDATTARRYLRRGDYLWNAGIFVWSATAILEELEALAPNVHRALKSLLGKQRITLEKARRSYRRAPSVSIDIAVLEGSRRVWTLPVDFHWSDVGTWASLAEELGVGSGRSTAIEGDLVECDSRGNLVWSPNRTVALLGVEGLAVVDTPDALLVTRLDRSSGMREVVARLKESGRADLT